MATFGSWMNVTISALGSDTGEIDLQNQYDFLCVLIPEMDNCEISLMVAEKTTAQGGTYSKLGEGLTTDEEKFKHADVWQLGGFQHIKIVSSIPQSAERVIRLRGTR